MDAPTIQTTDMPAGRPRPIWFAAKRYGWGWGLPIAWQGWVVLVVWMALMIAGASFLARHHHRGSVIFMGVMSAALIGICYARGERPKWRWGK